MRYMLQLVPYEVHMYTNIYMLVCVYIYIYIYIYIYMLFKFKHISFNAFYDIKRNQTDDWMSETVYD